MHFSALFPDQSPWEYKRERSITFEEFCQNSLDYGTVRHIFECYQAQHMTVFCGKRQILAHRACLKNISDPRLTSMRKFFKKRPKDIVITDCIDDLIRQKRYGDLLLAIESGRVKQFSPPQETLALQTKDPTICRLVFPKNYFNRRLPNRAPYFALYFRQNSYQFAEGLLRHGMIDKHLFLHLQRDVLLESFSQPDTCHMEDQEKRYIHRAALYSFRNCLQEYCTHHKTFADQHTEGDIRCFLRNLPSNCEVLCDGKKASPHPLYQWMLEMDTPELSIGNLSFRISKSVSTMSRNRYKLISFETIDHSTDPTIDAETSRKLNRARFPIPPYNLPIIKYFSLLPFILTSLSGLKLNLLTLTKNYLEMLHILKWIVNVNYLVLIDAYPDIKTLLREFDKCLGQCIKHVSTQLAALLAVEETSL